MMIPLVSFESLHEILRKLFDSMLPLCERMTVMASAIACIGALLYISYRVWQSIARAEPIDVFPLLRPFAMCICIIFFNTLVIGGLNGILSPIVKATHSLLQGQTFSMNQYQADKDKLEKEIMLKDPTQAYLVSDEEFDRQIDELGWMPPDLNAMSQLHQDRYWFGIRGLIVMVFGNAFRSGFVGYRYDPDILPYCTGYSGPSGLCYSIVRWLSGFIGTVAHKVYRRIFMVAGC